MYSDEIKCGKMTRGIAWLVLSCLMVLALLLPSCAPAASPTPTPTVTPAATPTTTPTATTAEGMVKVVLTKLDGTKVEKWVERPKYGGVLVFASSTDPVGFDDAYTSRAYALTLNLTNDNLWTGNWTRGRAGTGEAGWDVSTWIPDFEIGALAESWEFPDPDTVVIHIRKGVHYGLNPDSEASRLVGGRELVAEDVAFTIRRVWAEVPVSYIKTSRGVWFASATVTDKYTVVVKGHDEKLPTPNALPSLFGYAAIVPPEVVKKYGDMRDWKVSCGTGAFMLTDYVPGSSLSFIRNPNYWMKDPLHPENTLPYLDDVRILTIADASTRLAAIRTRKIDLLSGISWEQGDELLASYPELLHTRSLGTGVYVIQGRLGERQPFDDVRVRRALHMAIDFTSIKDEYYKGNAEVLTWPIPPTAEWGNYYTSLKELPESTRELFQYNPEKAKQLLTEAGYPKGFKTSLLGYTAMADILSIVKEQWAKIGVDITIDLKEYAVYQSMRIGHTYKEMICGVTGTGNAISFLEFIPGGPNNLSLVNDPWINQKFNKLWSFDLIENRSERAQLSKDISVYALDQAYAIQLPLSYLYTVWWPWVKGYQGENTIGYYYVNGQFRYAWVDENLKKEIKEGKR